MAIANRCSKLAIGLTVAGAIALVACRPAATVALTGHVTLDYSGQSESSMLFSLKNGSHRDISVVGDSAFLGETTLSRGYSISCDQEHGVTLVLPPLVDGWYSWWDSGPADIDVSPGEQLRLAISTFYFQPFKGGRCRLRLDFEDGSMVESGEFVP